MTKTKKIFGLILLSIATAQSAVAYGIRTAKKELQKQGDSEEKATTRLLDMINEAIDEKQESIKNSGSFLQKMKLMFSIAYLKSEKALLD